MDYHVIVIGGGPAGYTAALYAARAGLTTLVIEKLSAGGQMAQTAQIDNYPGFDAGIDGFELGMKMRFGAERFGVQTRSAQVLSAELAGKEKIVRTNEATYTAGAVIVATGADHKHLGLPEEEDLIGRGVAYCATCDGMFYRGKTVAVVGGGNSAAADALYLSRIAKKVYLIHRRDSLRADKVSSEPLFQAENVGFLWNSAVVEILHGDRLTGVRLQDGREVALDGLFISVGRSPATELFRGQLALDEAGYIVADESTKTSIPGVFAAGDVRTKPVRQIVTATADGATAAYFAQKYLEGQG